MEYSTYMHEIKNPLGVIYGIAQLLKTSSPEETKQHATMLMDSVERIKAIDSDFDSYRKTGKRQMKYVVVDVRDLLNKATNEYEQMAQQYDVQLIRDFSKARAFTDVGKLKQVIDNVISNAIKYNKPGGAVTVKCYTDTNDMHMIISDTGIGMSKREIESIGKPFYRAKKIDRPGTGLGLCTTLKLANLLNWDITISSSPDKGTKLHFTLHHIVG